MCGESAKRDRQVESSWSDDHEDGGPTIQLPAAEAAAPSAIVYLQSSITAETRQLGNSDPAVTPRGDTPSLRAVLDSDHPQDGVGDILLQPQVRRKCSKETGLAAFHPPVGQGEICRNGECRRPQPCRDLPG